MRLARTTTAVLLASAWVAFASSVGSAQETPPAAVPGPLRPVVPTTTPEDTGRPSNRPTRRDPAPTMAVRSWKGTLAPLAAGELGRGRVVLDVLTHQVRIDDFAVTDAPGLEVALVAADDVATTAAVLAAKRVSLGRLRRIKATVVLRFPAELDPAVYRTLVVWSRRDRAPRAVARLVASRTG